MEKRKNIEYIYDPIIVNKVLHKYPSLHQKIGNPELEGKKAISFPQCRKTGREIYRILSSQHYPHLAELLKILDYCINAGWNQPSLFKTRGQKEFDSSIAELLIAHSFLKKKLKVRGFDQGKGTTSIPDMLVESEILSLSVEVYCPRDWDGLEYFLEEMRLGILNLDVPWDFYFKINIKSINNYDQKGRILWFDPWKFSETNANPVKRWSKINKILSRIETSLTKSTKQENVTCLHDKGSNILIEVYLSEIKTRQTYIPVRNGTILCPTISGYAPEGMFNRLIERRILNKVRKGQAQSLQGAKFKTLIVDISKLGYTDVFTNSFYLQQFIQSIRKHLKPEVVDVDMIIFCFSRMEADADIKIPLIFRKQKLTNEVLHILFSREHISNNKKEMF